MISYFGGFHISGGSHYIKANTKKINHYEGKTNYIVEKESLIVENEEIFFAVGTILPSDIENAKRIEFLQQENQNSIQAENDAFGHFRVIQFLVIRQYLKT